jgi:hypothetical protein
MNKFKNWYKLKIDISNAINPNWQWPVLRSWANIVEDPKKVFSEEWLLVMSQLGLPSEDFCLLFYSPKNMDPAPVSHTDTDPITLKGAIAGFNFVIDNDPADMVWFDLKKLENQKKILYTEENKPYEVFPLDFTFETDRNRIGNQLTLVRTDIPHWIGTSSKIKFSSSRWSVSYRSTADNNRWKSWDNCVENLMPLIW